MTYKRRKELEALSLKAYGVKSRYNTVMQKGHRLNGVMYLITPDEMEQVMLKLIEHRGSQDVSD